MGERAGQVGTTQDEQEGDETTEDVEAVEAGGQEEGREVDVGGDVEALAEQGGLLPELAGDEHRTHDEGEDVPLAHAPLEHGERTA